jgi:hypothetical protein
MDFFRGVTSQESQEVQEKKRIQKTTGQRKFFKTVRTVEQIEKRI